MTWSVNNTLSHKSLHRGGWSSLVISQVMTAAFSGMKQTRHMTWKGSPGT